MNLNIDKDAIIKYLKMFSVSAGILGVSLLVMIIFLALIIPKVGNYFSNRKTLKEANASILQKEADLTRIKDEIAREEAEQLSDNEIKIFYKGIKSTGGNSSDILAGEIQEINDLIKYYGIKVYKVNYTYDDENDPFYKGKKEKYGVCKMDLDLFSNYMKFQGLLKDLYKHEHFLNIQSIEIKPYKKDKSILNIKLTLSLYAEKDGDSSAVSTSVSTVDDGVPQEGAENSGSNDLTIEF